VNHQDKAARIAKAEKARLKKKSKLPKWDQIEEHLPLDWDKEGDGYVSPEEEARCTSSKQYQSRYATRITSKNKHQLSIHKLVFVLLLLQQAFRHRLQVC
jgi:hypothetical protein